MAKMTLEEALAAATVDEELVTPVNEVLLINPETRTINVPDSEKLFGARQDMDVERKYFKCPRIVGDNIDLFEHEIFVNYVPSKQDGSYDAKEEVQCYWCRDLAVEGDFVTFSWKLSENVTKSAGYIAFAVYAKTIDEYGNLQTKWHTTIAIGNVLDTLPDGEELATVYPDIVMQLLERMDELENGETLHNVLYSEQVLTEEQKMQARKNIGAANSEEVSKLSEEKANRIVENASGEVIVVTDSDEKKPLGLAIDGKSEQNQYSGTNFLDVQNPSNTNTTHEILENGRTIIVKGTKAYSRISFDVTEVVRGKTVYILIDDMVKSHTPTDVNVRIVVTFADGTKSYKSKEEQVVAPNDITNAVAEIVVNNTATDYTEEHTVTITGTRVVEDMSALWEPFVGGKPSPSPEYKQEIRNIGVYDEASGKYAVEVKGTGKNLAKFPDFEFSQNGVTWTCKNGAITAVGTATGNNSSTSGDIYYLLPFGTKGDFVLSGAKGDIGVHVRITDSNGNKTWLSGQFALNGTEKEVIVYCQVINGKTANDTVCPMIRPAEITDDTYEPHKETTATVYLDEPLRKGDKAYWNGGSKIRVDRPKICCRILSDLPWVYSTSTQRFYTWDTRFKKGLEGAVKPDALCNMFSVMEQSDLVTDMAFTWVNSLDNGYAFRYLALNGDVDAWKQFLDKNEVYVEGEANEPITEEIDIDLGELSMFYPTTILSNDCNANMEVTYIADTKAYIDKKFAELATAMV